MRVMTAEFKENNGRPTYRQNLVLYLQLTVSANCATLTTLSITTILLGKDVGLTLSNKP
jgi:hypothetical protein